MKCKSSVNNRNSRDELHFGYVGSRGSWQRPGISLAARRALKGSLAALCLALIFLTPVVALAANVRVTTWNLEWFPNGSPKELPPAEQAKRIAAAADVLRPLNSDIIVLQEVKDYDVCVRLGEAISPHTYQVAICSAFKEPYTSGLGKQQVAILAKESAQAAWSEPWKAMDGVDPPRGFAFAWFKLGGSDVGVYSLHLKSNLIMKGNHAAETQKNIRKREVAIDQLLNHIREIIAPAMPMVKSFVVGGDFNTNPDQSDFAVEKTLSKLTAAGFRNSMEGMPQVQRVTHPGSGRYPDATFDYLFGSNIISARSQISPSHASDHYPVSCDFALPATYALSAHSVRAPAVDVVAPAPSAIPSQQFATITQPVRVKIPYGETVLPRGLKVAVLARDAQTVTVRYLDGTQIIPISSTDLH